MLVEHQKGIDSIDSILQVEGIDAIMIGPGDLAASMGLLGETQHPRVQKAIDRDLTACRAAGMPAMVGAPPDSEGMSRLVKQGGQLLLVGVDTQFLRQTTDDALRKAQQAVAVQ